MPRNHRWPSRQTLFGGRCKRLYWILKLVSDRCANDPSTSQLRHYLDGALQKKFTVTKQAPPRTLVPRFIDRHGRSSYRVPFGKLNFALVIQHPGRSKRRENGNCRCKHNTRSMGAETTSTLLFFPRVFQHFKRFIFVSVAN